MWCSTCPHTARSKEPSPKGKRRAVVHDARRRAAHPALGAVDVDGGDVGVGAEDAAQDARGVAHAAAEVQDTDLARLARLARLAHRQARLPPREPAAAVEGARHVRGDDAVAVREHAVVRPQLRGLAQNEGREREHAGAAVPTAQQQRASDYRPRRIDGVQRVRELGRVRVQLRSAIRIHHSSRDFAMCKERDTRLYSIT